MKVNYIKRKNTELFKQIEQNIGLTYVQNYIPIYKRFFALNDSNYNSINLNHSWHIHSIDGPVIYEDEEEGEVDDEVEFDSHCLHSCTIKHQQNHTRTADVFFKSAPLVDPLKLLMGKLDQTVISSLPQLASDADPNNSAYIDAFFVYLSNLLSHKHYFPHCVEYYGSFLGIKHDFRQDITDDYNYLIECDYFNKHVGSAFTITSNIPINTSTKMPPIMIQSCSHAITASTIESTNIPVAATTDIADTLDEIDISIKSTSSCSSRTSHTHDSDKEGDGGSERGEHGYGERGEHGYGEHDIVAIIPQFPIELVCMEACENTLDDLILDTNLTTDDWVSILMQVIMILIAYQKVFRFTHNDLHTNNVMYNLTDKKYIYYCYGGKYYQVPTRGRIFKIIDFGRSIYTFDDQLFCSDSFKKGGDAATQYNFGPYYNKSKPTIEPNYSFDLCRLACSIYDYVGGGGTTDQSDSFIRRIITEWCRDDAGVDILYKTSGEDRYSGFKLYKMIARNVHKHTPQAASTTRI